MATIIQATDIVNFDQVQATARVSTKLANMLPVYHHPAVGTIRTDHFIAPYLAVSDIHWQTTNDVELFNCDSPETININFFQRGRIDSRFAGINHDLNMRPGYHNIVFSPEGKDMSRIARDQEMNMFHISLDRNFFISSIGSDDRWSEHMLTELHHCRPVSAGSHNREISGYMQNLIDGVRYCNVSGPMRNLLIQSRLLELLALQVDQFRVAIPALNEMRYDEIEKLYELKKYLDHNFLSDLNLAQLSRICLLNEFKVKKGFKQLFSTTVFGYIRKLRMEYAGNLLKNHSLSIDEVADKLGYEHAQHFSIAFKKFTGVNPSQYQRKSTGHFYSIPEVMN